MQFIPIYPYAIQSTAFRDMCIENMQLHIVQHIEHNDTNIEKAWDAVKPFIILDNGTFEGYTLLKDFDFIRKGFPLLSMGCRVEYVAPDVLKDGEETVARFRPFLNEYNKQCLDDIAIAYGTDYTNTSVMVVPQGKDLDEWLNCLIEMIQLDRFGAITTIGIPKWVAADTSFAESVDTWLSQFISQTHGAIYPGSPAAILNGFAYMGLQEYLVHTASDASFISQQLTRLKMLWILNYALPHALNYRLRRYNFHLLGLANFTELGIHPSLPDMGLMPLPIYNILRSTRSLDSSIIFNIARKDNFLMKYWEIIRNTPHEASSPGQVQSLYIKILRDVINPVSGLPDDIARPARFFDAPIELFDAAHAAHFNIALKTWLRNVLWT